SLNFACPRHRGVLHAFFLKRRSDRTFALRKEEERYGQLERKSFHQAGNANRNSWSDHIGGWLGVWAKFLGGDLRRRARRHRSGAAGSERYRQAYRERADAYGQHQRDRRL